MDVAFLRFFITEKDNERKRAIFTTCWLLVLGAGSIFSFFVFYYSSYFSLLIFQSPQYGGLLKYTSGILWLDALAVLPFLILRAREQAKLFTILKLGEVVINLIMNVVYVVFLRKGAEGILLSFVWSSAFSLIVVFPLIYRHFKLLFDGEALKEILHFGLPYIIPGLSIWAMDLIDRQIIQYYLGEGATGVYGANYKFAMAMALFVAAFRFAWHPFFLSISDQPDAKLIYARILTYFIGFSGWCFLALSFFIKDIITFPIGNGSVLGPDYWGGLDIIPLVNLGYVFYGIHVNCVVSIYLTKKSYYLSINTALAALGCTSSATRLSSSNLALRYAVASMVPAAKSASSSRNWSRNTVRLTSSRSACRFRSASLRSSVGKMKHSASATRSAATSENAIILFLSRRWSHAAIPLRAAFLIRAKLQAARCAGPASNRETQCRRSAAGRGRTITAMWWT